MLTNAQTVNCLSCCLNIVAHIVYGIHSVLISSPQLIVYMLTVNLCYCRSHVLYCWWICHKDKFEYIVSNIWCCCYNSLLLVHPSFSARLDVLKHNVSQNVLGWQPILLSLCIKPVTNANNWLSQFLHKLPSIHNAEAAVVERIV